MPGQTLIRPPRFEAKHQSLNVDYRFDQLQVVQHITPAMPRLHKHWRFVGSDGVRRTICCRASLGVTSIARGLKSSAKPRGPQPRPPADPERMLLGLPELRQQVHEIPLEPARRQEAKRRREVAQWPNSRPFKVHQIPGILRHGWTSSLLAMSLRYGVRFVVRFGDVARSECC